MYLNRTYLHKICIAIGTALCISLLIWWFKPVHAADIIDFDTVTKVEIWSNNIGVTLTKDEDIRKFADLLNSRKLRKKLDFPKDGYVFLIDVYHKNGDQDELVVTSDVRINDQYYRCDRDYCDNMRKLYNDFQK